MVYSITLKNIKMSRSRLEKAINTSNSRYSRGLNDDDAVCAMFKIADSTKGFYVSPKFDSYEICTDIERLQELTDKYGYWSDEVQRFNSVLINKGGQSYKDELNNTVLSKLKETVN
jgi:hypothetical protein